MSNIWNKSSSLSIVGCIVKLEAGNSLFLLMNQLSRILSSASSLTYLRRRASCPSCTLPCRLLVPIFCREISINSKERMSQIWPCFRMKTIQLDQHSRLWSIYAFSIWLCIIRLHARFNLARVFCAKWMQGKGKKYGQQLLNGHWRIVATFKGGVTQPLTISFVWNG